MWLIVGLGNPGPTYAGNRHNIGFLAVDEIVRRHSFGPMRARFHGLCAEGSVTGEKVLALCPMTYMNDSGQAVQAAMQFFKLAPARLLVIHDEIDLPLGKVRVKKGGSAGGHNGLRSIDAHIGPDYWRLRLGVGHPGQRDLVRHYVLQDFAKEERASVASLLSVIAETLPTFFSAGENSFMNKVTLALNPPTRKETQGGQTQGKE